MPFTVEAVVIFPKKPSQGDPAARDKEYVALSSSLFGMHSVAFYEDDNQKDTTWNTVTDAANFQVYAVRQRAGSAHGESNDVYFMLTSSNANSSTEGQIPALTSSIFRDTYLNEKWNLAVKVKPERYSNVGLLSGSENTVYKVEFIGYNATGDAIQNSFHLTGTIGATNGQRILALSKRIYAGAHRDNFTGSVLALSLIHI